MDDTMNSIWPYVFRLAIFAVFITSFIEVVKGISVKGLKGIFTEMFRSLWKGTPMCRDTVMTLNFMIALMFIYAFDFGVIQDIVHPDLEVGRFALWLDYLGTASMIYAGADQLFKRFLDVKKEMDVAVGKKEGE